MKKAGIQRVVILLMMCMVLSMGHGSQAEAKAKKKKAGYKKAYAAKVIEFRKKYSLKDFVDGHRIEPKFDLIYIDDDQIPELVCDTTVCDIMVYTYKNGKARMIIGNVYNNGYIGPYSYGRGGNAGYRYLPKKNSLVNSIYQRGIGGYVRLFEKIKGKKLKKIKDDTSPKITPDGGYKRVLGKYTYKKIMKKLK